MRAAAATAAALAATAAAATALGLFDFLLGRDAAEFHSHSHIFRNLLLETFQLLLGVKETHGNLVLEKRLTGRFEIADLCGTEFDSGVLLLVKFLTAFMDALVLQA